MTKISTYSVDQNIGGNDKWIGSDAQNNQATKNFTPTRLAEYFNNNNVVDIGLSIRYRYQTLDPGEQRVQGTISFEEEIGPQVNFSAISTFLLAKNTLKQNNVSQYLDFLVGSKVIISKASNINLFGYYTITAIDPYVPDTNFFVVTLEFISGNGFIYEDLDYFISIVDKSTGGGGTVYPLQDVATEGNTYTDGTYTFYLNPSNIEISGGDNLSLLSFDSLFIADLTDSSRLSTFGLEILGAFGQMLVQNGYLLITDGDNETYYYRDKIQVNGDDYLLPNGDPSRITTEGWVDDNFYPLNSNPAGYLTQQEVEEYPDLASFPPTGTVGVIYIAIDTGLFYTWDGSAYISSSAPDTGITGGGIVNRLAKFTPDGVTIGSSNFSDSGVEGRYSLSATNFISFYPSGNIWLRLQRATTNRMDFVLGNSGIGQPAEITTSNAVGLEFKATGASAYISLKTGASSIEGLRVLSTGKLQFTQAPDAGATTDDLLVRDASGNVKILPYPTIPSVTGYVPYTGATQNVDLGEYELKAGQLTLDVSPTGTAAVGTTRWNNTIGSSETTLKGGSVILKNGVDLVARVVNKVTPNTTLTKAAYQAVRVSGAQGQRLAVAYAQANNDNNSADTIGLVCETIPTNQEGFILTVGQLEDINTTGSLQGETWNDGDVIYLSPTVAGSLTNVKPTAPGHIVVIGYVEYAHAINGKLYVKIMNGWELDELHNVKITSPQNNDVLMYNSTDSLWENENPFDYFDAKPVVYQKHVNMPTFASATINNIEGVLFVAAGATARNWADTNDVTRTQRLGLVVSTTGNLAQLRQSIVYFSQNQDFNIVSGFNMADNAADTGIRFFFGVSTNTGLFSNVEPNTLLNCAGFCRPSTSNNLHLIHNDNTGTATTLDLGPNFPANTINTDKYRVFWRKVPTGLYIKIERVGTAFSYETTLTSDIPALSTGLNFGAYIVDTSGANVSTGFDWHGTYVMI